MAKVPMAAKAVPTFKVEFGSAPPAVQRRVGAESSPYTNAMKNLPAPANGRVAQFFIGVGDVPVGITEASEQEKYRKEEARKITNRVSGIARRLNKADKSMNFAVRSIEEDGRPGVRVYRITTPPTPASA